MSDDNPVTLSNYFKDGKTVIDFVIVYERFLKDKTNKYRLIQQYLNNLKSTGLLLEITNGSITDDNTYVKISLNENVANNKALEYGIDINNSGHIQIPEKIKKFKLFQTPLTRNGQDRFIRKRGTTSAERILLINEILADTKFGDNNELQGIETLIKMELIKTAYPLHEYDPIWEHTEMVDDRKKLLENWANFRLWYKEQPLNLIEKYYGTEIAFYFAWLGFFIKMLIPASILGVCVLLIRLFSPKYARMDEVCDSEQIMCPHCSTIFGCVFEKLNEFCSNATLAYYFDNNTTVWFAILMSFWATIFLNLWTRYENKLKVRWNVQPAKTTKILDEYKAKAGKLRISPITGELETIIPLRLKLFYIVRTYGACLFWILIVLFGCIIVIYYSILLRTLLYTLPYRDYIVMMSSACLQIVFIKVFRQGYENRSISLTKLKNPRTKQEFDDSVLNKLYLLYFVNNYMSLFYIAFIKGRFYTPNYVPSFTNFNLDICEPTGCIVPLCIQLSFLMLFKNFIGNLFSLIKFQIKKYLQRKQCRIPRPQFEEDINLIPTSRYMIASHFIDMIIQYGFVTFFVGAFSLVPLLALIDNIIQLRFIAYKLTVQQRRPIPKKAAGLGVWMAILKTMTFLSTITNAFVIGFTSDFVIRIIYIYQTDTSLKGFINSTLSIYDMNDFPGNYKGTHRYCYYRANRNPPDHKHKYEFNDFYWYEVSMRLLAVIIFSHIVGIFNGFLSYAIPDIPQTVKESIQREKNTSKDLQSKVFKTKYDQFQRELSQTTIKIRRNKSELEEIL